MKKIKFLSVLLMLALANFALISCGSDDDGETGGASSGAPYTGVWTAVEMQIVEDGESFGGPIPAGYVMRLTLGEDGKYEYYYYSPGEDGDEPETITESGYWTFDKESSKIVGVIDDENGYGVSALGETDVLVWTASKLVTRFSEDDGYTQTTTWTR